VGEEESLDLDTMRVRRWWWWLAQLLGPAQQCFVGNVLPCGAAEAVTVQDGRCPVEPSNPLHRTSVLLTIGLGADPFKN
jgi:hypothetical protein